MNRMGQNGWSEEGMGGKVGSDSHTLGKKNTTSKLFSINRLSADKLRVDKVGIVFIKNEICSYFTPT